MESVKDKIDRRVAPAPKSFELHLSANSDFTRLGYGRKVQKLGGTYSSVRGDVSTRYVTVPNTFVGQELAAVLINRFFGAARERAVIVRGTGVCGAASSWITAQCVRDYDRDRGVDPALDAYNAAFLCAVEDRRIDVAPQGKVLVQDAAGFYSFEDKPVRQATPVNPLVPQEWKEKAHDILDRLVKELESGEASRAADYLATNPDSELGKLLDEAAKVTDAD
jgi:hypothetical protein